MADGNHYHPAMIEGGGYGNPPVRMPTTPPAGDKPAGWLIDDSATFKPWFLPYAEEHVGFIKAKRDMSHRIITLYPGPDA